MGNCSLKGEAVDLPNKVRVFTDSGGFIELRGPKLARDVLVGYPGYGIFRQGNTLSPLSSHEYLFGGELYHLLPLQDLPILCDTTGVTHRVCNVGLSKKENIMSIESSPKASSGAALDIKNDEEIGPAALQVLPSEGNGVWKVKLVIDTKQLEEILSEEGNTEALIEKMRIAAAAQSSMSSLGPRRSRSSWGMAWKPCIPNPNILFKVSPVVDMGANKN